MTKQPKQAKPRWPRCPICQLDISACTEEEVNGRLQWRQPIVHGEHASGWPMIQGGLVHVLGDKRCLSDARALRERGRL